MTISTKRCSSVIVDTNENVRPENTVKTKDIRSKFQNYSLEPVLFERLKFIMLLILQYSATSFVEFSVYRQSFAGILIYCRLLLQNLQHLTLTEYPVLVHERKNNV